MTAQKSFKAIIRKRQQKTGESYTTARSHVLREQASLLAREPHGQTTAATAEAVVLKVNQQSARVRLLGENIQVTYRSPDVGDVVPGHLVTLVFKKRWIWRGDAYASGDIENPRIDLKKSALDPLPLSRGDTADLRFRYEGYRSPDPYAPLWNKLTEIPRLEYEMDPITWGALPGLDAGTSPTCDASDLIRAGKLEEARDLLMEVLCVDLRCLDAHAHLGVIEFPRSPARAIVHYEMGVRIGELSLPSDFNGVLVWGRIYNRPFLRCLHGYALCLWRLGKTDEARRVFERLLSLNPNDNQGVRFCMASLREGETWDELRDRENKSDGSG